MHPTPEYFAQLHSLIVDIATYIEDHELTSKEEGGHGWAASPEADTIAAKRERLIMAHQRMIAAEEAAERALDRDIQRQIEREKAGY